ncbi:MAG: hypothetical protein ABR927_15860 [Bacteroidales bacterium]
MPPRVLLITPEFYGIEKSIKSVLEQSGYEVSWFENKILPFDYHGSKSKFRLLRKIYFLLFLPQFWYLRKELKKFEDIKFDILFAVNAHVVSPYLFRKLKSKNPGLHSVLYLWDSFSMYNWTKELKLFNKVYTFDAADSIKYQIDYKPNFYIKNNYNAIRENEYDLFFVGKFSPGRISVIDKIVNLPDIDKIKYFVKLWPAYKIFFHNHFIYNFFKAFNFKSPWVKNFKINFEAVEGVIHREYFLVESLNYQEIQSLLLSSNVILDLPYQFQTGYTHRLIEALANGKKVITTNPDIRKESFYKSEQIQVIDAKNPEIDCDWIKKRSTFPIDNYFLDLELSKWLKSMINAGIA